jgi:hypothetical protein
MSFVANSFQNDSTIQFQNDSTIQFQNDSTIFMELSTFCDATATS